jgi:hypothetical protein
MKKLPVRPNGTKPKRPRDVNQLAHQLIKESIKQDSVVDNNPTTDEISRVMAELGRRGGKIGGKARAEGMTAQRRSEIALKAARSRWAKQTENRP